MGWKVLVMLNIREDLKRITRSGQCQLKRLPPPPSYFYADQNQIHENHAFLLRQNNCRPIFLSGLGLAPPHPPRL